MGEVRIDAGTFQKPLRDIAEVIAQKVKREAPLHPIAQFDLHVLVRQAMWTYVFLYYLNADERRKTDCYWKNVYTIVSAPLVRNLIDCLLNVSLILQDPALNTIWYRKYGLKRLQEATAADEARYRGAPEWDEWLDKCKDFLQNEIGRSGLKPADVTAAVKWPLLGSYIQPFSKGAALTKHQRLFKTLLMGPWRQYSAIAHGTFEGLAPFSLFLAEDSIPVDQRSMLGERYETIVSTQLGRAASILLCVITEIQAKFRFRDEGARINERICEVWSKLLPMFEVKELYDEYYKQLMEERGIKP
ncbi:MAG TPA: hypothetical protein VHR84_18180 [Terriglobales bacterium]|jgi:hypothetical protein|nr:hypothetical protein [Terriglobales bacterium]